MSIIIVFIIMYIYYLTVYMFCISCYGTNKLLLCDFCTFVQINSIQFNSIQFELNINWCKLFPPLARIIPATAQTIPGVLGSGVLG